MYTWGLLHFKQNSLLCHNKRALQKYKSFPLCPPDLTELQSFWHELFEKLTTRQLLSACPALASCCAHRTYLSISLCCCPSSHGFLITLYQSEEITCLNCCGIFINGLSPIILITILTWLFLITIWPEIIIEIKFDELFIKIHLVDYNFDEMTVHSNLSGAEN